jgi:hypothetical protein
MYFTEKDITVNRQTCTELRFRIRHVQIHYSTPANNYVSVRQFVRQNFVMQIVISHGLNVLTGNWGGGGVIFRNDQKKNINKQF